MERNAILISEQDSVATVTEAVQRGDTVRWAAEEDACIIEHAISNESYKKLKAYLCKKKSK